MVRHRRHPLGAAALAVIVAILAIAFGPRLLAQLNPFGTDTRDRSSPALLQSLQKLDEFHAARANLQQVVDVEKDAKLLPSFIKGERVVLVAAGHVDATVDFRRLGPTAVRVSESRREVAITLSPARRAPAQLDLAHTRVVEHDRGLIDRTGDLLGNGGTDEERGMLLLAQHKLDAAAAADPNLLPSAERNTARMLERLVRSLGYERVTVRFQRPTTV